jgi:hypothetical protein
MNKQAKNRPYPEYVYRAHVHGHPHPRMFDDCNGFYSDNFGSDLHLWCEYDAESPIWVPIGDPMDFTVEDFFYELNLHLGKTIISSHAKDDDEQPFRSSLVSLSGDFRWTAQRICQVGRRTSKDQIPGLAIFKTSMINPTGVRIYRVEDMLEFFDRRLGKSSIQISLQLRDWASNANEYICWSLVPHDALVAFTPLPDLIERFNGGEEAFLTKGFVNSNYLRDFGQCPRVHVSLREYADRVSRFVQSIITDVSSLEAAKQLCMHIGEVLSDPYTWGYEVATFAEDLDEAISSSVDRALERAFGIS